MGVLESHKKSLPFYNPEICKRDINSIFAVSELDVAKVNHALQALEATLKCTSLSTCEIRIIVCLVIYGGLTHMELQSLTGMKQSAVSRAVTRLTNKDLVYSRIGKKYEVGRPYQLVVLNFDVNEFLNRMESLALDSIDGLYYLKNLRTEQPDKDCDEKRQLY